MKDKRLAYRSTHHFATHKRKENVQMPRAKGTTNKELTIPQKAALIDLENLVEQDAWDQLPGEPLDHWQIFTAYRMLGPNRTLRNTYRVMQVKKGRPPNENITSATAYTTLAKLWKWEERASAWDRYNLALQEEARQEIFQKGLALDYERVRSLIEVADILKQQIEKDKYPNHYVVEQFRGALDDIAKEVGGRSKIATQTNTQVNVVLETKWGRGGSASALWGDTVIESESPLEKEDTDE